MERYVYTRTIWSVWCIHHS